MKRLRVPLLALSLAAVSSAAPAWAQQQQAVPSIPAQGEPVQVASADSEFAYRAESVRRTREVYPQLTGEVSFEIQNDLGYNGQGGRDRELNDLFTTIEPELTLAFTERFSIQTALTFEPVEDADPGESRAFSQQGLFVEQLFANYQLGNLGLRAGKFNPKFGKAFDLAPGLYGVDFAEDYEITERIGAGAAYAVETSSYGTHTFSTEAFFADTSNLSRTVAGRGRGRVRRSDGGPSNTGRLNSYSLTVEGESLPFLKGLSYNLGFVYQGADDEEGRLERDYVAGLAYGVSTSENLDLEFLTEYALLDNFGGEANRVRRYLTASTAATYRDVVLAVSYTLRDESIRSARDNNDFLFQTSAGYFREIGIGKAGFEVAYLSTREENLKIGTLGLRLSWNVMF